jgi:hypothetical protein
MKNLLMMVVAISFLAIAGGAPVRAQVVDTIVADVPFDFTVRDSTLPAGKYTIKRTYSADPGVMQIRNADGDEVVLFVVGSAQAAKEPQQTRLIFDRVGDRYFLSEIFEEGNITGVELPKSRAERDLVKEGAITQLHSVAVPAQTGINARR